MEGYSVTEAASVLGVPTERVWELLARGVLSGAPDGETGMRVFLQPRRASAPTPLDHARSDATGTADRPEPAGELSPFRELLTEFRNLTERYGQALLALGEARGEVAALRSRVDLLEARMDLRLPSPAPAPWPDRRPEPASPASSTTDELEAVVEHEEDEHEPRRRRRRQRATENFAEALARAEDPTASELPGAADAAVALSALRAAATAEAPPPTDGAMPREVPAAEPMDLAPEPVSVEPATSAATSGARDDTVADRAVIAGVVPAPPTEVLVAASPEPELAPVLEPPLQAELVTQPEPELAPEPEPEPQPQSVPKPAPEVELATEPEPGLAPDGDPEPEPPSLPESVPLPELLSEPEQQAAREAAPEPRTAAPARDELPDRPPIDWDPERYTVEVAEPDWYEEELPLAASSTSAAVPMDEPLATDPDDGNLARLIDAPAWAEPELSAAAAAEAAADETLADDARPARPATAPRPDSGDGRDVPAAAFEQLPVADQPEDAPSEPEAEPETAQQDPEPLPEPRRQPAPSAAPPAGREEETMLWFGRPPESIATGADEMEVVGGAQPAEEGLSTEPRTMPGGSELQEALSALEALARDTPGRPPAPEPSWPREPEVNWPRSNDSDPQPPATTPASPTARAYRRLRRIFPG